MNALLRETFSFFARKEHNDLGAGEMLTREGKTNEEQLTFIAEEPDNAERPSLVKDSSTLCPGQPQTRRAQLGQN